VGARRDVTAGGRVYTVTDDLAVEHRVAARGRVVGPAGEAPPGLRVRPLHPRAFAHELPGGEYLLAVELGAVAGGGLPAPVRVEVTAPGYAPRVVVVWVSAVGVVLAPDVVLAAA